MSLGHPITESVLRICPQCGTETTSTVCKQDGFATVERARYVKRAAHERAGEVLAGRWRLDTTLRAEPTGIVYQGFDLSVGRPVAVRVVAPEIGASLERIARFQREGRFLASLAHPSIVQVFEHGVAADGTLYVAEELPAGERLNDVIARGPLEIAQVVALGRELFDVLLEAHAHGVQHRSLSLGDVWWQADGRVKVGGFGWVKVLADELPAFTFPRELGHAFATMAPEQARGKGVSGHADLYSAGAILYAALTGALPFGDGSPSDLLVAHAVKMPRIPERDGQPLHGPIVDLVLRCLEKKPWNRPDGAQAALDALELCAERPFQHTGPDAFADTPAPTAAMLGALERAQTDTATKQQVSTVERRAERPAIPLAAMPAPRIVRSLRSESPLAIPEPVKTGEELRPTMPTRRKGAWALSLAVLVAIGGGVIVGLVAASRPDAEAVSERAPAEAPRRAEQAVTHASPTPELAAPTTTAPAAVTTVPAAESPEAPEVALTPLGVPAFDPNPEVGVLPRWPEPVATGAPAATATDKPITITTERVSERVSERAPDRGRNNTKRPPGPPAAPPAKDPFADLEDPSIAPTAKVPAVTRKVLVDSDPPGATVSIDGRAAGQTPLYVEWDDAGDTVNIRLDKAGFRTIATSLGPRTGRAVFLVLKALDSP